MTQPERKENNFYTNRWLENPSQIYTERERIIMTYRSAWSFGFHNRLRGDAVLQWTSLPFPNFASALTGCLAEYLCHRHYFFFFLISAKQITTHHPPLPNKKMQRRTHKQNLQHNKLGLFLSKNSPLTQESERTRQAARSPPKRKIAWWSRREYFSTRHRSIVNTKMYKSKRVPKYWSLGTKCFSL